MYGHDIWIVYAFVFTQNIMILGDFNADGRYMSKKERKALSIFTDKNFHWLIIDEVDTTTSTKNDHTYDRFVCISLICCDTE